MVTLNIDTKADNISFGLQILHVFYLESYLYIFMPLMNFRLVKCNFSSLWSGNFSLLLLCFSPCIPLLFGPFHYPGFAQTQRSAIMLTPSDFELLPWACVLFAMPRH